MSSAVDVDPCPTPEFIPLKPIVFWGEVEAMGRASGDKEAGDENWCLIDGLHLLYNDCFQGCCLDYPLQEKHNAKATTRQPHTRLHTRA